MPATPPLAGKAFTSSRHYYASVMLAGGVSIKELAEYLGHADPAFTLRVYAHLLPSSHDRARTVINDRVRLPAEVRGTGNALTEQRRNRPDHEGCGTAGSPC